MRKNVYQFPSLDLVLNNSEIKSNLIEAKKMKNPFDEGFQQGFNQGKALGFEEAIKNQQEQNQKKYEELQNLENLLISIDENLKSLKKNYQTNLKQEIIKLIEKVTIKTLQAELKINSKEILNLVEKALKELNVFCSDKNEIIIFLNPEDLKNLQNLQDERLKIWQIYSDENLLTGEIHLKVNEIEGVIDCRKRVKNFVKQIEEQVI